MSLLLALLLNTTLGEFTEVKGFVTIKGQQVVEGTKFLQGDHVITGIESSATLSYDNGCDIKLEHLSQFRVDNANCGGLIIPILVPPNNKTSGS